MDIPIITKLDLQEFRLQLIRDIEMLLKKKENSAVTEWLRGHEVKKMLKISTGTLQNLRIAGKLRPAKIGGLLLYSKIEIDTLLKAKQ